MKNVTQPFNWDHRRIKTTTHNLAIQLLLYQLCPTRITTFQCQDKTMLIISFYHQAITYQDKTYQVAKVLATVTVLVPTTQTTPIMSITLA